MLLWWLDDAELHYPSTLDNTERRFIHDQCNKLGLTSKSYGCVPCTVQRRIPEFACSQPRL